MPNYTITAAVGSFVLSGQAVTLTGTRLPQSQSSPVGSEATTQTSRMQSLLSGEPIPNLPDWNPSWSLTDYHLAIEEFHRKLLEYIRRLMGRLTSNNIAQAIIDENLIDDYISSVAGTAEPIVASTAGLTFAFGGIRDAGVIGPTNYTRDREKQVWTNTNAILRWFGNKWVFVEHTPQGGDPTKSWYLILSAESAGAPPDGIENWTVEVATGSAGEGWQNFVLTDAFSADPPF